MANGKFQYTRNGQPVGYAYTSGGAKGFHYTIGGQPAQHYTIGGHPIGPTKANVEQILNQITPHGDQGVVGNLFGQLGSIVHGLPSTIEHFPGTLEHTFGPQGVREDTGIGPIDSAMHWLGLANAHPGKVTFIHDPQGLGGQTVMPVAQDAKALRRGDWHYFEQHPLNPILDVATVASLGGGGALRLAAAGRLGERAAELANTERLLKVGDRSEALYQARTLQGRYRQAAFDRWSMAHPDAPRIGANPRMAAIGNRRLGTYTLRAGVPMRKFQQLTKGLTPAEVFAFHVAAEGVPLEDRIAYYASQYHEAIASAGGKRPRDAGPIGHYLQNLTSPEVKAALDNPRPEFTAALHAGAALEAKAGERLVGTGELTPEIRANRAALPQRLAGLEPNLEVNPINSEFPAPFRFYHTVTKQGEGAGLYTAPKVERTLGKTKLPQLRKNYGKRFADALFSTNPERVLSMDYLSTMRHGMILDFQHEFMGPVSHAVKFEDREIGFKKPHEWFYRPSTNRATTAPIKRDISQQEALAQDRLATSEGLRQGSVERSANAITSPDIRDLGADAEKAWAEKNMTELNRLGIRVVPAAFGKQFRAEFKSTNKAWRLLFDRPMDVWRAMTLTYRPAWMVNNFVGNGIMLAATHGLTGLGWYLRVLLSVDRKGPEKVTRILNWTWTHPTLRRKFAPLFDEFAPELHHGGLFGTQTAQTHLGFHEGEGYLQNLRSNPTVRKLGIPPRVLARGLTAVGHGVTRLEVLLAEDTTREAAFLANSGADIARIKAVARQLEGANIDTYEALRRLGSDPKAVERNVNLVHDALGNFNDLSPLERRVIRRAIPFYSWFKVITKVSAKYAARYPARLLLLKNMEQALNQKGEPALPSWLDGAIRIGSAKTGVQTVISTQGINPYETIPQIGSTGPGGVWNPFAGAIGTGLFHTDVTFGTPQTYHGFGAGNTNPWAGFLERAGGSFVGNLAPARLYTETTSPYGGHAYNPHTYHAGPVNLNDFLLQYLGVPIRHVRVTPPTRGRP